MNNVFYDWKDSIFKAGNLNDNVFEVGGGPLPRLTNHLLSNTMNKLKIRK